MVADALYTPQKKKGENKTKIKEEEELLFVGWLLNVPATCECISGTDLLRQFYLLLTLRKKLQTKLSISPSHSVMTPGQPVPVPLWRRTP